MIQLLVLVESSQLLSGAVTYMKQRLLNIPPLAFMRLRLLVAFD